MKSIDLQHQKTPKRYELHDLQHAIEPFEDVLIANLPSKEEVLARAKQRKIKKNIATSALAVCFMSVGGLYWLDPVYQTQQLSTQLGETKHIYLLDGSEVHLNTATKLTVNYKLRSKNIELHHGEAMFTVKHYDWQIMRPLERDFIVRSGNMQIKDIGTIFNVRQFNPQHSVVTVLQGQVQVSLLNQATIKPLDIFTSQSVEYNHQMLNYQVNASNLDIIAWQQGNIQFNTMPLAAAIVELQRYHKIDVQFRDSHSRNIRISGRFKIKNAEQFMQILPTIAAVNVSKDQSGQWIIQQN